MNFPSIVVVFLASCFVLAKGNENICDKPYRYDAGCCKKWSNQANDPNNVDRVVNNDLPNCVEGGLWKHVQCNITRCRCVYVDTGREFVIENLPTRPLFYTEWEAKCPKKTQRTNICVDQPPVTYPCSVESDKYAYNSSSRKCEKVTGCFGFHTSDECEQACVTSSRPPRQHHHQAVPRCNLPVHCGENCALQGPSTRYWFNSSSGMCQRFHHLGCGGNVNNHPSAWKCTHACAPKQTAAVYLCFEVRLFNLIVPSWIAQKHNLSSASFIRVSFTIFEEVRRHAVSVHNITNNTNNAFTPERLLQEELSPQILRSLLPPDVVCIQDPSREPSCRSTGEQRWYYDTQKSKCTQTSLCGSTNGNNFQTEAECTRFCSSVRG